MKALGISALILAAVACRPASAEPRDNPAGAWGFYGAVADSTWLSTDDKGGSYLIRYSWSQEGAVLTARHEALGEGLDTVETITGDGPGRLRISTMLPGQGQESSSNVELNADGSAVERWTGAGGEALRAIYVPIEDGRYQAVAEVQHDGAWVPIWRAEAVRVVVEESGEADEGPSATVASL